MVALAPWTTLGTRTVFHNEGGTESRLKAYKVQMRPDPLARWKGNTHRVDNPHP